MIQRQANFAQNPETRHGAKIFSILMNDKKNRKDKIMVFSK